MFRLQLLGNRAASPFDFSSQVVPFRKYERIPVLVFEAGEGSAPSPGLRRMAKANPGLTPGTEFGRDIFGNKYGVSWATDELIFFRFRLGGDEREQRGTIRRGNQNKAGLLPKVVINDQTESKLVQVESKASILVANENGNMVKTEVRVFSVQAKRSPSAQGGEADLPMSLSIRPFVRSPCLRRNEASNCRRNSRLSHKQTATTRLMSVNIASVLDWRCIRKVNPLRATCQARPSGLNLRTDRNGDLVRRRHATNLDLQGHRIAYRGVSGRHYTDLILADELWRKDRINGSRRHSTDQHGGLSARCIGGCHPTRPRSRR